MAPPEQTPGPDAAAADLYAGLAAATPEQRTATVLRLIEGAPDGRLVLPARGAAGAVLDDVKLGRAAVRRTPGAAGSPAWWSADVEGACLKSAVLRGAKLRRADLRGADLRRADLSGADLSQASLSGATLEEANLADAELAGVRLARAALGGADLRGARMEEADARGAGLRFADLRAAALDAADVRQADLWGANLENASASRADIRRAVLREANLRAADLSGADLRGADLSRADLRGARLAGADLRGAVLSGADLCDAALTDAHLQGVDLSSCDLARARVSGAWLEKARLERRQFGGAVGEEVAGDYGGARKSYLVLERAFDELGDHDAASWAYRRRRRVQKRESLRRARAAWGEGRPWAALRPAALAVGDQLVEWVCDYGESIPRVLLTLLATAVLFTALYRASGAVVREEKVGGESARAVTNDPVELALFSLLAMAAPGNPPEGLYPRGPWAYLLMSAQSILAVFLIGLLGFVAGNRIRR